MINKYDVYRNRFISSAINGIQDPAYITFGLRFDFFHRLEGGGYSLDPGLLTGETRRYLLAKGDMLRVNKLDYFINLLKRFTIEEPWWITSLSNINELFKLDLNGGRLKDDYVMTVTSRESVDLKFLSFMEAYRSISVDKVFMREMLPKNLKKFDMNVYLIDQRVLLKPSTKKNLQYANDYQGIVVLKLVDCEFVFDGYSSLDKISNETPSDEVTHSFGIKVDRVYEVYNLPTSVIYGYTGTGYYSDDMKQDFNFITNLIRPKSTTFAESGNERYIKNQEYSNYVKTNKIDIENIEEESAEEALESRKIEINGVPIIETPKSQIDLGVLDPKEIRRNEIPLNLDNPPVENSSSIENSPLNPVINEQIKLNLERLNPSSFDNIRTING